MLFRQLIDYETRTFTYLLADKRRRKAVLIDPVLGQTERDLRLLNDLGLDLKYVLETGVHGDHLSGAATLRAETCCKIAVPEGSGTEGADLELSQGDAIFFGLHALEVRLVPGRTEGNAMYVTSDLSRAFVGSTLLVRELPRMDHPDSDPRKLWRSLQDNILVLPDYTELYPGRDFAGFTMTSIQEERRHNPFLKGNPTEEEFLARFEARVLPPRDQVDVFKARNRIYPPRSALTSSPKHEEWAPIERSLVGVPEVSPEWVYNSERHFRVIDVRSLQEFDGPLSHIEGAELVPLGTIPTEIQSWDRNQRYVTVCRSGGRSGRAAMIMEEYGFTKVASMAGGMGLWDRLGFKTARDK